MSRTICAQCGVFVCWESRPEANDPGRRKSASATGPLWTDTTIMPWGCYRGTPLGQIRPSYLALLSKQAWIGEWPELAAYIATRLANQTDRPRTTADR